MTKRSPKSNVGQPSSLTAEQHGQLLVAAEAELRDCGVEDGFDLNLSGGDLRPHLDGMIKMVLRYENIMEAIATLPKVESALKHALRHESQHALSILLMKSEKNKASAVNPPIRAPKTSTPAPQAANFHLNLLLPQAWDQELSEIGFQCRSQGGHKFSKTEVLRCVTRLLLGDLRQHLDLSTVRTEDEFLDRLRQAAKKL
jgi:hypothetical protein